MIKVYYGKRVNCEDIWLVNNFQEIPLNLMLFIRNKLYIDVFRNSDYVLLIVNIMDTQLRLLVKRYYVFHV